MTGFRQSLCFIALAPCGKPASLFLNVLAGGLGVKGNLDNLDKEGSSSMAGFG
jgi:hypothetical protein